MQFYESLEPLLPHSLHSLRTIFKEHRDIISLCGTFPHRDHYYNRTTSVIGKSLMDNPVVPFGLPLCEGEDGKVFFGHDQSKLWQTTQRAFDVIDWFDALINYSARRRSTMPAKYMTNQRSAEFAELFRTFDKDGSGFLEIEELAAVLASTGHRYSDVQLQDAVDHVAGRKGSHGLTFSQFAILLRINLSSALESRTKLRFDMFDADQSGEVSLDEFTACVQGLDSLTTTAEAAAMFKKCDRNGDGAVSLQEFMGVIERRISGATEADEPKSASKVVADPSALPPVPAFNTSIWEHKQDVLEVQVLEVPERDTVEPGADSRSRCTPA